MTPAAAAGSGRKARTRAALLAAAGELFATTGVEETTVDQIAAAAGVTPGALYVHFRDKEAVALVFAEEALADIERRMAEAWASDSPFQRILGSGDAYFAFALAHPVACRFAAARGLLPHQPSASTRTGLALRARVQSILITIAGDVKQAIECGEIVSSSVEETMLLVWSTWNGLVTMMVRPDELAISPDLAERSMRRGRDLLVASLSA